MLKVSYAGFLTPYGGYGIYNLNFIKHLERQGIDVVVHDKYKPKPGSSEWNILTAEEKRILSKPYEERGFGIVGANPFDFDSLKTKVRVANTMCESSHINKTWVDKLNSMDYIIVPNEWNYLVFKDCGVTRPIAVIPPGVDTKRFKYYDRPKRDVFTFGILGYLDQFNRKGTFELMRAFASEFSLDEPVRLVLKSSDPTFGYYSRFYDNRIKTIIKPMDFNEINEMYRSFDCFVFPSKAEGVGLPPREAMATGLPTILTNFSGLSDIAHGSSEVGQNNMISFPLTPTAYVPRPHFIEQDGLWAMIDEQELMYWMRWIYEHQEQAKKIGHRASKYMNKNYSWEKSTALLKLFIESICTQHGLN